MRDLHSGGLERLQPVAETCVTWHEQAWLLAARRLSAAPLSSPKSGSRVPSSNCSAVRAVRSVTSAPAATAAI